MGTIDLGHLRRLAIFAAVVDQGSFASAAKQMGMSRSSVSEQVALLESALEFRLLQRTTRQLSLTTEGAAVYDRARVLSRVVTDVSALTEQDVPGGRVRLTTTTDFAAHWLVPRLALFHKLFPNIYVDLILSDNPLDLIAENIDLAIRIGRPRDAMLIARPIRREAPQVIASQTYVETFGEPTSIEELARHTWILIAQINPGNRVALNGEGGTVEFVPDNYHLSDSPLVARVMIESSMGIGFHLPGMVESQLQRGSLRILLPEWREEQLTYSIVYPSRHNIPLRTRRLIDFLVDGA